MPSLPQPQQAKLTPADLDKLWDDPAAADANAPYQAIAALAAAPEQSHSLGAPATIKSTPP
jgi:hypothetical protein